MELHIPQGLVKICFQIVNEHISPEQWAQTESDDMFQSEHFSGGYDADEIAFCFSYYNDTKKEYWFQLTLEEVKAICDGSLHKVNIRPAE